jgi:hypothetical protein
VYDALVSRRERIYQGELVGPDGVPFPGDVWREDDVAIVFRSPSNATVAVLRGVQVDLVDEHLRITGVADASGESETFEARPPDRLILNWVNVNVEYPDGRKVEAATVRVYTYRVVILKAGEQTELVGATASEVGGRRLISYEGEQILVKAKAGCGCGGKR